MADTIPIHFRQTMVSDGLFAVSIMAEFSTPDEAQLYEAWARRQLGAAAKRKLDHRPGLGDCLQEPLAEI